MCNDVGSTVTWWNGWLVIPKIGFSNSRLIIASILIGIFPRQFQKNMQFKRFYAIDREEGDFSSFWHIIGQIYSSGLGFFVIKGIKIWMNWSFRNKIGLIGMWWGKIKIEYLWFGWYLVFLQREWHLRREMNITPAVVDPSLSHSWNARALAMNVSYKNTWEERECRDDMQEFWQGSSAPPIFRVVGFTGQSVPR